MADVEPDRHITRWAAHLAEMNVPSPGGHGACFLAHGDRVELFNDTGSLTLQLRVSDEVQPGVALSPKGRWPKQEPVRANVNVLNPGRKADVGGSSAVHSIEVSIRSAGTLDQ